MVAGRVFKNPTMPDKNALAKVLPDKAPNMLKFTAEQLQRLHFLQMAADGYISLRDAAEKIGVSYRQAKRLKQSFLKEGARSVVHGNAGRRSHRSLSDRKRVCIVHLARTRYAGLNDSQITKMLAEEQGITLSRETVRRLLRAENISSSSTSRPRRQSKPPYCTSEGMMVLWGEITQNWFGAGECCFMAAVDVATLQCLAARFVSASSSDGYLFLLREILKTRGVPRCVCQHRIKMRHCRDSAAAGSTASGVLERALKTLGVNYIFESARKLTSIPGLFQKYLSEQIEMRGITSIEKANLLLEHGLMAGFNREYASEPHNPQPAWRAMPHEVGLDHFGAAPARALARPDRMRKKRSKAAASITCR